MLHFDIVISGKVQGVWFRQSTFEKAKDLDVKGYVKNQPDGTVKIEAEGSIEKLKQLLNWCRTGPQHANVESVDYTSGELKNYKDFSIS